MKESHLKYSEDVRIIVTLDIVGGRDDQFMWKQDFLARGGTIRVNLKVIFYFFISKFISG